MVGALGKLSFLLGLEVLVFPDLLLVVVDSQIVDETFRGFWLSLELEAV